MLVAIDQFRDYLQVSRRLSPHTLKSYSEDLLQFVNFLTDDRFSCTGWEAVDHRLIRGFLGHLQEAGLARRSIARKLSALRTFYRYLRRRGAIDRDPTVGVVGPKQDHRLPSHLLPPEMDPIRTVEIVDLDLQADGGTHVRNTFEVGGITITRTENKGAANKRIEIVIPEILE